MASQKVITLPRPDTKSKVALAYPIMTAAAGTVGQCHELSEKDQIRVKQIIQHLIADSALPQKCCSTCKAEETKTGSTVSNFIPVLILPASSANTDIDMVAEVAKFNKAQIKPSEPEKNTDANQESRKDIKKKRVFTLQRFTDFDLLSQW